MQFRHDSDPFLALIIEILQRKGFGLCDTCIDETLRNSIEPHVLAGTKGIQNLHQKINRICGNSHKFEGPIRRKSDGECPGCKKDNVTNWLNSDYPLSHPHRPLHKEAKILAHPESILSKKIEDALEDFQKALVLAGVPRPVKIESSVWGCPHRPTPLPKGKMAVYLFQYGDKFWKIGKVGMGSNSRFQFQHYDFNAGSTLAKSLRGDKCWKQQNAGIEDGEIGEWIKQNLIRTNLLIDGSEGDFVLSFLESFLHLRFSPLYEGKQVEEGLLR